MSRELTNLDVRNKFKGYPYQDLATSDVFSLHTNFKSLKPQDAKPFIHSNGSRENCVSVTGTIPVKIRAQQYNIPITLWIRPSHPYVSPMVYVTPTPGMGIQQSRYVDTNGMVYLPYISEWKQGSSDLSTLVQVMCATFAEACPVYSKSSATPYPTQNPAPYARPSYPRPMPPYPQQQRRPPYGPQQQYPPYPAGHMGMPTPSPRANYRPPPASGAYGYGANPPYPPTTGTGYPPPRPSFHQPTQPTAYYHPQVPTSSIPATAVATAAAATLSAEDERKQIEANERIKRQSLESAVEEKIRRQVKQVLDAAQEEMETLLQTQEDLKRGSQKVNAMLQEMENKKLEIESSVDLLQSKNAELESMLDYLRAQPEKIDVDGAITAINPLHNQILQLYAEENAIDDTIYYLGEALRKGVIELELFLKHVRELSRQQFMARATIMKARSTAGLPDYG